MVVSFNVISKAYPPKLENGKPLKMLENDVYEAIRTTYGLGNPLRYTAARHHRLASYPEYCPAHGDTPHRIRDRRCRACASSARSMARGRGDATFLDRCDECGGDTPHSVKTGGCAWCRKTRAKKTSPRAEARRRGDRVFEGVCDEHGAADHSVLNGKCLSCFTTAGAPRAGPRVLTPRALARQQGAKSYYARCDDCDAVTDHHVQQGRCLTCFTTMGVRRVRR